MNLMRNRVSNTPVTLGRYVLIERLGTGGMAEVWKAKMVGPAHFERVIALKRILPHLVDNAEFVSMFLTEARISARLNHPNIVAVFELGQSESEYFLAMEYVPGRDLNAILRTHKLRGALPPGFAAHVMGHVCRALGYAHALRDETGAPLNLIHRDVSLSNVMIRFDGGIKLLDFGIAKAVAVAGQGTTDGGILKGKFGYMSPEQVKGHEMDHRSDLFCAGILLHETLAGRRLFKGASDVHTLALIAASDIAPPSKWNPDIPAELDRITLRALQRDPAFRYQTGEDMANDLDRVARELGWGSDQLSGFMDALFPTERTETYTGPTVGPTVNALPVRSAARSAKRSHRGVTVSIAFALALAVVGAVWMMSGPSSRTGALAHQNPPPLPAAAPVAPVAPPAGSPAALPPVAKTTTTAVSTAPTIVEAAPTTVATTPIAPSAPPAGDVPPRPTGDLDELDVGGETTALATSTLRRSSLRTHRTRRDGRERIKPMVKTTTLSRGAGEAPSRVVATRVPRTAEAPATAAPESPKPRTSDKKSLLDGSFIDPFNGSNK